MSTGSSLIGRVVAASTRHPLLVLLLAAALTAAALVYMAGHFAMTADTAQLISSKLKWRQKELAFEAAFPQLQNLTLVVVEGATPELADDGAKRLAAALQAKPKLFGTVRRPDGGPFFDREGLLLLPLKDVEDTTRGLTQATPLLGALAADPSLRGTLSALSSSLQGVEFGQASLQDFESMMTALADTFEKAADGQPAFFSWRALLAGKTAGTRALRRIILVQPALDFTALEPGQASSKALREMARSLGLDPAHGVAVRLTGPVPLADEEFGTLAQDAHLILGAMIAALLGILWLAVRSVRVVLAILITTLAGLVVTAAVGLLATGRFNLISVAFIPLFVGLGADFSIQFCVRGLAERITHHDLKAAMVAAGDGVGRSLALSAASIGAGFFAFYPTSYTGVAELGTIAGLGMIVAFFYCIILLPALLVLLRPSAGRMSEVGFTMLAPVEIFLRKRHSSVLAVAAIAAVGSIALLPRVHFDFNPLNLKSAKVESMETLNDLAADPDLTPEVINILTPSLAEATALAQRLDALPEVSRTVTLRSFVPSRQEQKLALVGDTARQVESILKGIKPLAPPSDPELVQSLTATVSILRQVTTDWNDPAARPARRLGRALQGLRDASPEVRAAAQVAVVLPLRIMLEQVRVLLQAGPVTMETLPPDLVADWLLKDGRARVEVLPQVGNGDNDSLRLFGGAVQAVAPGATGWPIYTISSGDSVVDAFLQAGIYSIVAILVLLAATLRRLRDVVLTMLPVLLSGLLTFATCGAFGLPLNFTNIIALPLLFGIGVAFNIYFVIAWRAGETSLLQSSLMRAVVFSALTTATAFGALWLSTHPGTASMGRLLMISLGWEILVTLLVRPALLARPPAPQAAA